MNCGESRKIKNVKNDDYIDFAILKPLTNLLDCLMELAAATLVCF